MRLPAALDGFEVWSERGRAPGTGGEYHAKLATPFAVLGIRTLGVRVDEIRYLPVGAATLAPVNRTAERVCREIERYLDDPGRRFTIPFTYAGTPFQVGVWQAIHGIPRGRVLTYSAVAKQLKTGPRAVGNACGANRLPLVIPCHRVVAAGGIGGFMGVGKGAPIDIKRWLLRHEGAG
ncbi:MAG: methylated-DNA--[protein]-cysteine S-methyltransferase [Burkholderiales bacterium]